MTERTVLTQTETESYRVIFRARPITTTVLHTRLVTTVHTSLVTHTLPALPAPAFLG